MVKLLIVSLSDLQALAKLLPNLNIVGGWVRDYLLGLPSKDLDLATSMPPLEVISTLEKAGYRVVPTGLKFGMVEVLIGDTSYEITTFRCDKSCDGRHALVEWAKTIQEDLSRRDFTINSMAIDLSDGSICDPYGGQADLAAKVIRTTGSAKDRFDFRELGNAHKWCYAKFFEAVSRGEPKVILDNTNIRLWELTPYLSLARYFDYETTLVRCIGQFQNLHLVPPDKVEQMRQNFEPCPRHVCQETIYQPTILSSGGTAHFGQGGEQ